MFSLSFIIYLMVLFGITTIGIFYILGIIISCVYVFAKYLIGYTENFDLEQISLGTVKQKISHNYNFKEFKLKILKHDVILKSVILERNKDKNILFIHGVNSGITGWLNIVNSLVENYDDYNIHLLYLPGFGVSIIENINGFLDESQDYISRFFSHTINLYIEHYKLKNTILVGHSLGGYFSLNYLCDFSKSKRACKICKVITVNPVGLISSLGYQGFYTVFMLKYGILNNLFNSFSIYSYNFCIFFITIYKYLYGDDFWFYESTYYHYATLTSPSNYSYLIINKLLDLYDGSSYFSRPIIHRLLVKQDVPIHIISSEHDVITSKSYNDIIKFLEESGSIITIFKDKAHSPFNKKDSEIIANIIHDDNNSGYLKKIKSKKSFELKNIIKKYISNYDYTKTFFDSECLLLELQNFYKNLYI